MGFLLLETFLFSSNNLHLDHSKPIIIMTDLKLENTLLDGSTQPRVKICDFGYSKSAVLDSAPKSTVGTPAYIAPEVLQRKARLLTRNI